MSVSVQFFCNPMSCSPPDSSVYGIFQARRLEWVAISFSKGSSQPRDQRPLSLPLPASSSLAGRFFTAESPFVPLGNKCGLYTVTISVEKSGGDQFRWWRPVRSPLLGGELVETSSSCFLWGNLFCCLDSPKYIYLFILSRSFSLAWVLYISLSWSIIKHFYGRLIALSIMEIFIFF